MLGLCLLLFKFMLAVWTLLLVVGSFLCWWFNDGKEQGVVNQVEDSALKNLTGDETSEFKVVVVSSSELDAREGESLGTKAADELVEDGFVKDVEALPHHHRFSLITHECSVNGEMTAEEDYAFIHWRGGKRLAKRRERKGECESEGKLAENSLRQDTRVVEPSVSKAAVELSTEPDLTEERLVGPQADEPVDTSFPKDAEVLLRQYPFSLITPEGPGNAKMISARITYSLVTRVREGG
ncbi:hypothetical protein BDQ17DRAFT_352114 [Cyathus striatus]|nr:hypothetical protein BDQ17DRAFT_352114 [Cyathus striatus]